jgi:UDP-glucuronate decarboxylase
MSRIIAEDLQGIVTAPLPWDRFAGKKVLVTGAGGIIGSYLVWTLLELNRSRLAEPVSVHASGRNLERLESKLGTSPYLNFHQLDLSTYEKMDFQVDFILHAASPSRTSQHKSDPFGTVAPNVFGTQSLLDLAYRSRSEGFVFVSSGAVYGQPQSSEVDRVTEKISGHYCHLNTAMSYAESKRMGEFLCLVAAESREIPATIARLGHTYGPGLEPTDERTFADFVFRVLRGENLILKSSGSAVRPFCYLSDAVVGLFTVLLKGKPGEAYNLVNTQAESSVLELAYCLCQLFPEKRLKVEIHGAPSHSFQDRIYISTEKIEALGWKPAVGLRDGFRRTIESYN